MDFIRTINNAVQNLPGANIYELLDYFNIEVQYEPLLITHRRESMIIISSSGKAVIFLRPTTDMKYAEFLLWHEIAHYVLHYKPNTRMNYYLSTRREETERQANIFAVLCLLRHDNLADQKPLDAAVAHGVPRLIAADVIRILAENRYTLK